MIPLAHADKEAHHRVADADNALVYYATNLADAVDASV